DHHTFTVGENKMTSRRVDQLHSGHANVSAVVEPDEVGTRQDVARFPGAGFLGRPPPVCAIAINRSLTSNGNVREVFPADERDEIVVASGRQPVAATL